jgi:hypothetical protein
MNEPLTLDIVFFIKWSKDLTKQILKTESSAANQQIKCHRHVFHLITINCLSKTIVETSNR